MKNRNFLLFFVFAAAFAPLTVQCQSGQAQKVRLIIRIDDMGCSHPTNTGIREAYKEGIGKSVEVMVPTPWFPEAVSMLKEMPGLDAGVHLVLTSEWTNVKWRPLTQAPSLVNDWGYFYPMIWPNDRFPAGSALQEHPWDIKEVEKELRAQIELAKREIPQLSHLSSHMGCLNMNDETKALFQKLGKEYGLDVFLEDYQVQGMPGLGDNTLPAEKRVEKFIENLRGLTPGNWLFVEHPAHDLPEQQAIGHPGYEHVATDRAGVLAMLTDPRVKAAISELGIEVISYADLKAVSRK
ncbi:MAG TPA: polysaccharide deacetylase family protein [Flavilitoribacter sp.]|nr:polysaccharide deacetylase family protein [Flavilitoribacter sp.]